MREKPLSKGSLRQLVRNLRREQENLRKGVLDERERCARVAEKLFRNDACEYCDIIPVGWNDCECAPKSKRIAGKEIAAAIRKGDE